MRAAVIQPDQTELVITRLPDPTPGDGQIVFKVKRCGICGTDVHMTSGHGAMFEPGMIPGHEYAGEVVAIGNDVSDFAVGDPVAAMPLKGCGTCPACKVGKPQFCDACNLNGGGYAEYAAASADTCILLPKSLTMDDGALVEPMAVGFHGVNMSGIEPGSNVLVFGAGPIGLAAIFFAKQAKAGKIAVAARSRSKENWAMQMGADIFLDPDVPLTEACNEAFGGAPDIVFECAGVVGMLAQSIDIVKRQGTVVVLGFCTVPDSFVPATALSKEVRLQFSMTYSLSEFENVARIFDAGHIEARSMISHRIGLAELPVQLKLMQQSSDFAKVMVDTTT